MNKSLLKFTAIAVCFAFLLLSFPGAIQAQPRNSRSYFQRIVLRPLALFAEFFSFLPFYDLPDVEYNFDYTEDVYNQPARNEIRTKMKVTGGLSSHRLSEED